MLDYGCGDGTFLKIISDIFPNAVGADLAKDQILDCQRRFVEQAGLRFVTIRDLPEQYPQGTLDIIMCMEVLEHCVGDSVDNVLSDLAKLAYGNSSIVISVPIEIGPTLLVKQSLRRVAGWRNLGDYKSGEKYSLSELLKMVLANSSTAIERPVYNDSIGHHGHKGFNWRALEKHIQRYFEIRNRMFTPNQCLGRVFQ